MKANSYDLVLMDIQMPKMDGITATRIIRELAPPKGKLPIIATTANVLPDQVKQFMQAGMDGHVGKPINQLELKTAIQKVLEAQVTHSGSEGADGEPSFDAEVYERVRALLPPERPRFHLESFDAQLTAVFGAGLNSDGLAQAAHKLVSQAGMLGFGEWSERCRELEQSCVNGDGAFQAFAKTQGEAT